MTKRQRVKLEKATSDYSEKMGNLMADAKVIRTANGGVLFRTVDDFSVFLTDTQTMLLEHIRAFI